VSRIQSLTKYPSTTQNYLIQSAATTIQPKIQANLLIQKIWTLQIERGEPLGTDLAKEWKGIAEDLSQLHQLFINRPYFNKFNPTSVPFQMSVCASVYLCSDNHTAFVMEKSCLVPLKSTTQEPNSATTRIYGRLTL